MRRSKAPSQLLRDSGTAPRVVIVAPTQRYVPPKRTREDDDENIRPAKKPANVAFLSPYRLQLTALGAAPPQSGVPLVKKPFKPPAPINALKDAGGGAGALVAPMRRLGFGTVALGLKKVYMRVSAHDPNADNALVLFTPPPQSAADELKADQSKKLVHVVVDPVLCKFLRPHQREGVTLMYNCLTGQAVENVQGAMLADDMGLGKTLQTITVIWTLLRQGPESKATCRNAIVIAPATLVPNWRNEVTKWLGSRLPVIAIENGSRDQVVRQLDHFITMAASPTMRRQTPMVLVLSYETARMHVELLKTAVIDLLLCDEGHRLKNPASQTYTALNGLSAVRRVIISGTPLQNDLQELHALYNFATPGLLGDIAEFRRRFEQPILRGRDSGSTDKEVVLANERQRELISIITRVTIRRTNTLNLKYLPVKAEMVLVVKMAPVQDYLYRLLLASKAVRKLLSGKSAASLSSITMLRQLCNHPSLAMDAVRSAIDATATADAPPSVIAAAQALLRPTSKGATIPFNPALSGKMDLLDKLLAHVRAKMPGERVVIVSTFVQTLDLFAALCRLRRYKCSKLDGSLSIKARQKLIDEFNRPTSDTFCFLLSSKAGGCGVNLVGANHLVLFDLSWNPSDDAQAKARVWRDGQKRQCYIYTMVSTGTLEEKILQRQAHKTALSAAVVDECEDLARHFSRDDLRDLFSFKVDTASDTHDQLKCRRCVGGVQGRRVAQAVSVEEAEREAEQGADLAHWDHFWRREHIPVPSLRALETDLISFCFHRLYEAPKTL